MGDHIHPHLEGMWATSTRNAIHIMIPPMEIYYLGKTLFTHS